jgi:sugar/nucleoside kinase (ribokinase family)
MSAHRILFIGAANLDLITSLQSTSFQDITGSINEIVPTEVRVGGVIFNMGRTAFKHGYDLTFIPIVGRDPIGETVINLLKNEQLGNITPVFSRTGKTPIVPLIFDASSPSRRLSIGCEGAAIDVFNPTEVATIAEEVNSYSCLFIDGYILRRNRAAADFLSALFYKKTRLVVDLLPHDIWRFCKWPDLIDILSRFFIVSGSINTFSRLCGITIEDIPSETERRIVDFLMSIKHTSSQYILRTGGAHSLAKSIIVNPYLQRVTVNNYENLSSPYKPIGIGDNLTLFETISMIEQLKI